MATVQPRVLRTQVAAEIPNVPNPAVDKYIVLATRMLCGHTAVWQMTGDVTDNSGVLNLTDLEDSDTSVVSVMPRGVAHGGAALAQFLTPDPGGSDPGIYIVNSRTLMVANAPTGQTYSVTAQVQPTIDAQTLPGNVTHDYEDTIVHGALYRLFRMPQERWAHPEMAQMHLKRFQEGVARARADVPRQPVSA